MLHFTYATPDTAADLQQGDVLKRTPALDEVILQYHPYYQKKVDYTHFLVLTQSCDLVRRQTGCGAPYIALSVIRPLNVALTREALAYQNKVLLRADALSKRNRGRMEMFVRRLLNNNEPEYFYLHEENSAGLSSSCAFLRLAISIRSDEHYAKCQEARILTLNDEFRPKLGWLMGNIFARVGTADWHTDDLDKEVRSLLDSNIIWLDEEKIKAARLTEEEVEKMTPEEIRTRIAATMPPKRKDQVIDAVVTELLNGAYITQAQVEKLKLALANAPTIASQFK